MRGRRPGALRGRLTAHLGAVGGESFSLMLGAAAASVVLAPLVLSAGYRLAAWLDSTTEPDGVAPPLDLNPRRRRAVVCGYGRVGRIVGEALERRGFHYVVIEMDRGTVERLRARGIPTIRGSATNPIALERADLAHAAVLVIALPNPLDVRLVAEAARRLNTSTHRRPDPRPW